MTQLRDQQELWTDEAPQEVRSTQLIESPLESPLWDQIERAIWKCMAVETCNVTMTEVKEKIRDRELGVLVALESDVMTGLALLTEEDEWLAMPFLWSAGLPSLNAIFLHAEEVAGVCRLRGTKFATVNDKAGLWAKRHGYKVRQIEYAKGV